MANGIDSTSHPTTPHHTPPHSKCSPDCPTRLLAQEFLVWRPPVVAVGSGDVKLCSSEPT